MRTEDQRCSFLALDAEAMGERPLSETERSSLANDPERRRGLDEHRRQQRDFLRRFPTLANLSAATRAEQRRPAPVRNRLHLALVPLAVAAVLALVVSRPQENERIKGTTVMPLEMAVVRAGVARAFVGQAVRAGDKLIFRTRIAVDYLSIFSLEASGRVQAIVTAHDGNQQSLALHLPPNTPCPQGIEVDDYPGHERIVAVASAVPLPAERIAEWLRASYAAMRPEGRATLPLGPAPFAAQVTAWLLEKETTP